MKNNNVEEIVERVAEWKEGRLALAVYIRGEFAHLTQLHQELQKARAEDIKRIEVADVDIPPFPSTKDSDSARIGFITGVAWARTKLQSKLDQPK